MSELKPCPFCGGEAETLTAESMYGGYLFGIMCNDCCSRGDVYDTEAEAIAAWNTRAAYETDDYFYLPKPKEKLADISEPIITPIENGVRASCGISVFEEAVRKWQEQIERDSENEIIERICDVFRPERTCRNVHEDWEKTSFAGAQTAFCCSECGAHYVDCECYYAGLADAEEERIRTNYCPNCGRRCI